MEEVLSQSRFSKLSNGWSMPPVGTPGFEATAKGAVLSSGKDEVVELRGRGVHTWNGDSIELRFRVLEPGTGWLRFGFEADQHEHARVEIDFGQESVSFWTSDWRNEQPITAIPRTILPDPGRTHTLLIEKTEGTGNLIKNADITVYLDGERIMSFEDLDVLPEMGVLVQASDTKVLIEEFTQRGSPSGIPEKLHIGGYQVLNVDSIEANFESICQGLRMAADAGVELLVTPEMSLTGLYPMSPRTREPGPVAEAETKLQKFIRDLPNAPHTIVGLPVWAAVPDHGREHTRYIASRVYDPDGEVLHTARKVHSAEQQVWHGYQINEFDINGVPISLHICHDRRYPELQTLPVMFGNRLNIHPSNGGDVRGSVSGVEAVAKSFTATTHAFYANVNAGGGSYIVGPQPAGNLIVMGEESRRDNPSFPMVGEPIENFFHAEIRVHDAFGYWPTRSFRASESIAQAYVNLYQELGGSRV